MQKTLHPRYFGISVALITIANAYILGNDQAGGRDAWLCVLLAALLLLPLYFLYAALSGRFAGKTLFEIMEETLGARGTRALALVYAVYGVLVIGMSLNTFGYYVNLEVLPDTPAVVMEAAIVLCAAYLAVKGGAVIGKWAAFVLPAVLLFILISLIGSIPSLHPSYLLPAAEDRQAFLRGILHCTAYPAGEPVLLFSLLPAFSKPSGLRHWALPFFLAALLLAAAYARGTMVLGGTLSGALRYSTSHADSITDHLNYTQHTEVLTSLIPAAAGIMETSAALLFTEQAMRAVWKKARPLPAALAASALALTVNVLLYPTGAAVQRREEIWPLFSLPLQLVPPLVCLCAALWKSRKKRGGSPT